MAKRELVPTAIRTEFGEVLDEPAFHGPLGQLTDLTYVPGYSDMRFARDLAVADAIHDRGDASKVNWRGIPTLPVRLQWARTHKVIGGQPDNTKEVQYGSAGYRFADKSDIGKAWLTGMPRGAVLSADGTIRQGDCTLMICDSTNAARNAAVNQLQVSQQIKQVVEDPFVRQGKPGQTWVETEAADHQIAAPPPLKSK